MSASLALPDAVSPTALALRRFLRNGMAVAALALVVIAALLALAAPWVAPQDPADADLFRRLCAPAWAAAETEAETAALPAAPG